MEYWSILLSIVIGLLSIRYLIRNYNFFKRNGIFHVPLFSIRGKMSISFRQLSFADSMQKLYNFETNAKYFGVYIMTTPVFYFRDPELIKDAFVKNFEAFPNHRGFSEIDEPFFSKNLISLKGQKWRDVRSLLSPAFTSSKLKAMFVLMSECAVNFTESLARLSADGSDMDMKDAFSKYTNDVIATCAFGIKVDSMKNPSNEFYIHGKDAANFTGIRGIKLMFLTFFPRLKRMFNLKLFNDRVINFFKSIIKTTIDTRDAGNITRPDMLQLMMDVRGNHGNKRELSIDEMTAHAFGFFFGAFDTSSTSLFFIAYEIAHNPDIQAKLQQDIDNALEESNGEVTYEVINRLEYLEAVINEALRLYPPGIIIERVCETTYELPPALPGEKPFTMRKGMAVWAPVFSIHRDEKYYDEPEKFRPERFLGDHSYYNSPYYMPFGIGPRMCIANRFALLKIKVLLFHLLARCELKLCANAKPKKLSKGFRMMPEGGYQLNVRRRSNMHPIVESKIGSGASDA